MPCARRCGAQNKTETKDKGKQLPEKGKLFFSVFFFEPAYREEQHLALPGRLGAVLHLLQALQPPQAPQEAQFHTRRQIALPGRVEYVIIPS